MATLNAYPEKPVVPYQKTTVSMTDVVAFIKTMLYGSTIKIATYVMFRNESANGSKGINNNYCGFQADSRRWDHEFDSLITGTVELHENGTHNLRRFLALRDYKACLEMLAHKVMDRGLYVGGETHTIIKMDIVTPADWCRAYKIEWVTGDKNATVSTEQMQNLLSMYRQGQSVFS